MSDGNRDGAELLVAVLIGKLLCPCHPCESDLHVAIVNHKARLQVPGERAAIFHTRRVAPQIAVQEHVPCNGAAVDADQDITLGIGPGAAIVAAEVSDYPIAGFLETGKPVKR